MAESIRETMVQYPSDKVTMRAYVAAPQTKDKRPAIIVIQELPHEGSKCRPATRLVLSVDRTGRTRGHSTA